MFFAVLFVIAMIWKQFKCPSVYHWIKKKWHIYAMEYYSPIKNETPPFAAAWMNLEGIMLSKVSQHKKDKYNIISLMCGI